MAKTRKTPLRKYDMDETQELEDLSFMLDDPSENAAVNGMLGTLVESSHHHMNVALELTKIIISKSSSDSLDEEKVLSIFKHALKAVSENCRLKSLWEQLI
jgi:hypothetical protein